MSDYVPTERQMLTAWLISSGASRMGARHQVSASAEFDRFVASVKAKALRGAALGFALSPHVSYPGTVVRGDLARRADQIEEGEL